LFLEYFLSHHADLNVARVDKPGELDWTAEGCEVNAPLWHTLWQVMLLECICSQSAYIGNTIHTLLCAHACATQRTSAAPKATTGRQQMVVEANKRVQKKAKYVQA